MQKGVDVSVFQGNINWQTVRHSGNSFAIIKATQGHSVSNSKLFCFTDSKFKTNIVGASKAGLEIGVYHYFTAQSDDEVVAEANHFINTIKPYKHLIKLWAAVDVEDPTYCGKLDKATLTNRVRKFMSIVKSAGFETMLYTNPNYIQYKFIHNAFDRDNIWLAHWGVSKPFAVKNMKIWQYGTVTIGGVKFDANYGYFDEDKLIGQTIEKSSKVKIKAQAKYKAPGARYTEGANVPYGIRTKQYDVISVATFDNVECALLGGINSWVATKYLERV